MTNLTFDMAVVVSGNGAGVLTAGDSISFLSATGQLISGIVSTIAPIGGALAVNPAASIVTIINVSQNGFTVGDSLSLIGNGLSIAAGVAAVVPGGQPIAIGLLALGTACSVAGAIISLNDLMQQQLPNLIDFSGADFSGYLGEGGITNGISDQVGTYFNTAQTPPRRDPLMLDLNGDGVVSHTSLAQSSAYFDHDVDGVATHTGWVGAGDGLLVFDKNANGLIDNGSELFGDHFIKANGQHAIDGFDALASLDTNGDGQFNSLDAAFAQVQVWKDLNGNGITDAGELMSLAAAGIVSFNVTPTSTATGGAATGQNQTAASGSYTTTAGTQSSMGEAMQDINLAQDTFHSQFLTSLPLTAGAQNAALVMGSGMVRSTQEAFAMNNASFKIVA